MPPATTACPAPRRSIRSDRRDVALALLLVLAASLPSIAILFRDGTMAGFDIQYHTVSFAQFVRAVLDGHGLPRWAPDMGGGYGYPNFLYQPPLAYLLALPAHMAGASYAEALDTVIGGAMVASGVGMFLFAREWWGNRAGVVSGIAYVYAPYHLVTAYIKGAVPELLAMALWPFALWALTRCLQHARWRDAVAYAVLFALVLFSNHLASVMLAGMSTCAVAVHAIHRGSPSGAAKAVAGFVLALALGAWSWLPALAERGLVAMEVMTAGYFHYSRHFVSAGRLLYAPWGYDAAGYAEPFTVMLGVLQVVALAVAVATWRRHADVRVRMLVVITSGSCLLALPLSAPVWEHVDLVRSFQFPWRFVAPAMFAGSALVGWAASAFGERVARLAVPLAVLVALVLDAPHAVPKARIFRAEGFADPAQVPAWTHDVMGSDVTHFYTAYLPVGASVPGEPRTVPATLGSTRARGDWNDFVIDAPRAGVLRVNTFWFPHWRVRIDGQATEPRREPLNGLLAIDVPAGRHRVTMELGATPVRRFAGILPLIAAIGVLLAFAFVAARGWRRERRGVPT